jgi:hypothetical protein
LVSSENWFISRWYLKPLSCDEIFKMKLFSTNRIEYYMDIGNRLKIYVIKEVYA